MTEISIVVPAYNEWENIPLLHKSLADVLRGKDYEVVFVDDGSKDRTFEVIERLHAQDKHVKCVRFRKNFGQTAAFDAGIKMASGKVIVTMDADLQNDPNDIPRLIQKLGEGYDCVSGWRASRRDPLGKRVTSVLANSFRKLLTGEKIHDSGCSLKAYRRDCFVNLDLFGETHRFIPAILLWRGFKVGEIKVNHLPRKHGKTKYGIGRVLRGFLDLLIVKFWMQYSARPMHLFGGLGMIMGFTGFAIGLYLMALKLIYSQSLANRPLLLLSVVLLILGVQFIILGVISDILVKTYFSSKKQEYYSIMSVLK
ncbi:glycosyltransferase family 2 protein [Candidatus Woesearchaeota archaeon]|nr:glycosyltransferase family 2 protein [Candidatus Woesearchaeota archaeon]